MEPPGSKLNSDEVKALIWPIMESHLKNGCISRSKKFFKAWLSNINGLIFFIWIVSKLWLFLSPVIQIVESFFLFEISEKFSHSKERTNSFFFETDSTLSSCKYNIGTRRGKTRIRYVFGLFVVLGLSINCFKFSVLIT